MKALAMLVATLLLTPVLYAQSYDELDDQALAECYDLDVLEKLKAQQKYVDEQIKPELSSLLDELQAMRGTTIFKELGFSSKNLTTADWRTRVEQCRDRLAADDNVPALVKAVPGALLSLGLSWVNKDEAMAEWDFEQVKSGLDWYFGANCAGD